MVRACGDPTPSRKAGRGLYLRLSYMAANGIRGPVTKQAALRAAAWCEFLEAHARRCYGLLKDDGLRAAQALANQLEHGALEDGFTLRDVRRVASPSTTTPLRQHSTGWRMKDSAMSRGQAVDATRLCPRTESLTPAFTPMGMIVDQLIHRAGHVRHRSESSSGRKLAAVGEPDPPPVEKQEGAFIRA
jgi:hypothetical protein